MKHVFYSFVILLLFACNNQTNDNTQVLQNRIDSLQNKLADTYKPGFGEFMSSIQVHHAKLWFAAQNKNWKLADFEIDEIKESLDDIKKYCTDRKETADIAMINSPVDNLSNSIEQENSESFKNGFILLTSTCNKCHVATDHAFNVIKIPDTPPFSNQDFHSSVMNSNVQVSDTTKAK